MNEQNNRREEPNGKQKLDSTERPMENYADEKSRYDWTFAHCESIAREIFA